MTTEEKALDEHTPDTRPEIKCKWDDCEDTFKLYPDTLQRKYCDKHQRKALKEELE